MTNGQARLISLALLAIASAILTLSRDGALIGGLLFLLCLIAYCIVSRGLNKSGKDSQP